MAGKVPPTDASGGTECANDGCTKRGLHLCGRCRDAKYCSTVCQKMHWKKGGLSHKQECIPAGEASAVQEPTPAVGRRPAAEAGARCGETCEGTCIICLCDDAPFPIQTVAAMLGWHTSSVVQMEWHFSGFEGWSDCARCGQVFSGAMQMGLAEAWWSKERRLPKTDEQRLAAANFLASTFNSTFKRQGKYADAETMFRAMLEVQQNMMAPEQPNRLATAQKLASALYDLNKYAQAEFFYPEVIALRQKVLGDEHRLTLATTSGLAVGLWKQGRCSEAETMHRGVFAVQMRVLGPRDPDTDLTVYHLALALRSQGKHAEIEAICRELLDITAGAGSRASPHRGGDHHSGTRTCRPRQARRRRATLSPGA
jgi:hypothetical protein